MSKPVVAIVGRPNVGKSTLFNKIVGKKVSIIEDIPGVTRDRIYSKCEWLNHEFMLVDTGGIEPDSDDIILSQMRRQAELNERLGSPEAATDYELVSKLSAELSEVEEKILETMEDYTNQIIIHKLK